MFQLKTYSVLFSKLFRFCSHANSYLGSPLYFQDFYGTLRANPGVTIHVIFPPMSTETFGVEHRSSMHEATQVNCRQWMHFEGVRPPKDPSITWIKITKRIKISLNIAISHRWDSADGKAAASYPGDPGFESRHFFQCCSVPFGYLLPGRQKFTVVCLSVSAGRPN